jgi:hypothetical protein
MFLVSELTGGLAAWKGLLPTSSNRSIPLQEPNAFVFPPSFSQQKKPDG